MKGENIRAIKKVYKEGLKEHRDAVLCGICLGVFAGWIWGYDAWIAGLLFLIISSFIVSFFLVKIKTQRDVKK